ncbi:MAG: hypothetical protein WCS31_13070, partial [Verrucomicrobiae bacterium]
MLYQLSYMGIWRLEPWVLNIGCGLFFCRKRVRKTCRCRIGENGQHFSPRYGQDDQISPSPPRVKNKNKTKMGSGARRQSYQGSCGYLASG